MKTLLLATRNPGKVREIQAILAGIPFGIKTLLEVSSLPVVEEDGATIEENARKKAFEIFKATGLPTLSDDTGLEVVHLDMKPGVISARYAGERASYADNYRKLLRELEGVPAIQRAAQFRCIATFIDHGLEESTEGICRGTITTVPRGIGGFGYDPVFLPEGYEQTFGELPDEVKNRISHRGKAFLQMKKFLLTRFS